MAQGQIVPAYDVVDPRRGRVQTGVNPHGEKVNMGSINEMRTRLAALNAGYYTAARLDAMTLNDMVYALKDNSTK